MTKIRLLLLEDNRLLREGRNIFSQGEPADSLFYLREGKVKLAGRGSSGAAVCVGREKP